MKRKQYEFAFMQNYVHLRQIPRYLSVINLPTSCPLFPHAVYVRYSYRSVSYILATPTCRSPAPEAASFTVFVRQTCSVNTSVRRLVPACLRCKPAQGKPCVHHQLVYRWSRPHCFQLVFVGGNILREAIFTHFVSLPLQIQDGFPMRPLAYFWNLHLCSELIPCFLNAYYTVDSNVAVFFFF